MEEDEIDVAPPKRVPGGYGPFRRVNHAQVNHLSTEGRQPACDLSIVTIEPGEKAFELAPVCVQTDAEQADTMRMAGASGCLEWSH